MPAALVLTAEESTIVRAGGLEDPTYRPFPSSRQAQRERDEEYLAEAEGPEFEAPDPELRKQFQRDLAANHWSRHAVHPILLLGQPTSATDTYQVLGIARAQGGPRSGPFGTRRVTIGPWDTLSPPLSLSVLLEGLSKREQNKLIEIINTGARPLSPKLGTALAKILDRNVPEYNARIRALTQRALPRPRERLERRDATATALSILTPRWRGLQPDPDLEVPRLALAVQSSVMESASETDFTTDDSAVFPGWERSARSRAGWWGFRHRGRQMWIKNINASTAESTTGAAPGVRPRRAQINSPRAIQAVVEGQIARTDHAPRRST